MTRLFMICVCIGWVTVANAQRLRKGDEAPKVNINDVYGKPVNIPNINSKKTIVAFMRYVGCPVCNFRINELVDNYEKLKAAGYTLIVIYESDPETLKGYLIDSPVPFTMIGDPKRLLYKKYKVRSSFFKTLSSAFSNTVNDNRKAGNKLFGTKKYKRDGKSMRIPADFIITAEGKIEKVHYGKTLADHLPLKEVL